MPPANIRLVDLNLETAERLLCLGALERSGSILAAAELLGITRHALRRRMTRLGIEWPRSRVPD